jgi:hypothetical protein
MRRTAALAAATLVLTLGAGIGTGTASARDAGRIRFAPGATSGTVSGSLPRGGEDDYTFDAAAGQSARVDFSRSSGTERWVLVGPQGSPLHTGMTEQQDQATVTLPGTGTYRLQVQTTDPGTYTLRLTLPVRIRFAAGGTSATVSGSLAPGGARDYTFDARAGQTAEVRFSRSSPTERWVLVSPQGSPLHTGMTTQQGSAAVRLPDSGPYRLDVETTAAGSYVLRLTIPAG